MIRVTHQGKPFATFAMEGEKVVAQYETSGAQLMFEEVGLLDDDGRLFASDGRAFYNALVPYLTRSTQFNVVDVG